MTSTSQQTPSTNMLNEKVEKEDDEAYYSATQLLPVHPRVSIYAYLQIACGCLAIVAGLCAYVVGTWQKEYGTGVWSGILFVASGVTGFIAKHVKDNRTLLGFFFVSAFVAGTTIIIIIFHVMALRNEDECVTDERLFNIKCFSQGKRRGLDAFQTILALTAFIVLLLGCRSVYTHLCRDCFQNTNENHERRDTLIQCC